VTAEGRFETLLGWSARFHRYSAHVSPADLDVPILSTAAGAASARNTLEPGPPLTAGQGISVRLLIAGQTGSKTRVKPAALIDLRGGGPVETASVELVHFSVEGIIM
jgi:hypothetical protein